MAKTVTDQIVVKIEKLGVVQAWTMRVPKKLTTPKERAAYALGFSVRTQDWQQQPQESAMGLYTIERSRQFYRLHVQREAFLEGYHDANAQEVEWDQ